MRSSGVRGVLVYCSDYRCSHHVAISGDRWPDEVRLLISSRSSSARLAAREVLMSGRILIGISRPL
jgi:hypothetical protein